MKKAFLTSLGILLVMHCVTGSRSFALGVGLYTRGSGSISTMNFNPNKGGGVDYILGAGLVLDTAVAKNKHFNYRLYLGYDTVMDSGGRLFDKFNMHRAVFTNTFGFAVHASKYIRLWLGPVVSFQVQYGNAKYSDYYYSIVQYENYQVTRKTTIYIIDPDSI